MSQRSTRASVRSALERDRCALRWRAARRAARRTAPAAAAAPPGLRATAAPAATAHVAARDTIGIVGRAARELRVVAVALRRLLAAAPVDRAAAPCQVPTRATTRHRHRRHLRRPAATVRRWTAAALAAAGRPERGIGPQLAADPSRRRVPDSDSATGPSHATPAAAVAGAARSVRHTLGPSAHLAVTRRPKTAPRGPKARGLSLRKRRPPWSLRRRSDGRDGRRAREEETTAARANGPARLRRREPPTARVARASPVAMQARRSLAPHGAATEETTRDKDADRRQRRRRGDDRSAPRPG